MFLCDIGASLNVFGSRRQEAGVVAVTYAKARGLEAGAGSPAHLLLDADLSDALYKARTLMTTTTKQSAYVSAPPVIYCCVF